jgi:hypothetical protein
MTRVERCEASVRLYAQRHRLDVIEQDGALVFPTMAGGHMAYLKPRQISEELPSLNHRVSLEFRPTWRPETFDVAIHTGPPILG